MFLVRLLLLRQCAAGVGPKLVKTVLQTRGTRLRDTVALDLKLDKVMFTIHAEAVVAVERGDVEKHLSLADAEGSIWSELHDDGRALSFYSVQVDCASAF